jgi:outer membrane protein
MSVRGWLLLIGSLLMPGGTALAQTRLSLRFAVEQALAHNPSLRVAQELQQVSQARFRQARAGWWPRLDLQQGFSRGDNPIYVFGAKLTQRQFSAHDFALPLLNAPPPLDNFQTRLTGQALLFDSGRTHYQVEEASLFAASAAQQTEEERQSLIAEVMRTYYDWLVALAQQQAASQAVASAQASVERARNLEQAGLVVSADRMSAEVFLAQMQDRFLRARNQVELARLALARLTGIPASSISEPADQFSAPEAVSEPLEQWVATALAHRPLLQATRAATDAAAAALKLARAQFGPTLGLYASFERDALTLGGPSGTNWLAGVQLNWNLFAGGSDRAALQGAQARYRASADQLDWVRSGIELEVRQAFLTLQAAAQRVTATRDAVDQAEESLRIIQNRYAAGLVPITELLRAQAARLDAHMNYAAALHDWHVARMDLERAAGLLTPNSPLIPAPGARP